MLSRVIDAFLGDAKGWIVRVVRSLWWRERRIRGWETKVTGYDLPSDTRWGNIAFRLFAPDSTPAKGQVRCRLTWPSGDRVERDATWGGIADHAGRGVPHYAVLYEPTYSKERMEDGVYRLRWYEEYRHGWRGLTTTYAFTIREGELKRGPHRRAKREEAPS